MGASRKFVSMLFDIPTIYKLFPIKSRKPIKSLIFLQSIYNWLLAHAARVMMDAPSMNQPINRDHSFFLTQGQCYGLYF